MPFMLRLGLCVSSKYLLALVAASHWLIPATHAADDTPNSSIPRNVLIIQTDEHNFRTLGCYRSLMPEEQALMWGPEAIVETPNIDSLAQRGALCTSFYATSPVCTPSRAALVSGRYPQNTGASSNDLPLRDEIKTFAWHLQQAGYATGFAGKWHLDGPAKPGWAPDRKFGFADNRFMFNRGHWKQLVLTPEGPAVQAKDAKDRPSYSVDGADQESFTTDWLTDRTLEFIDANAENSFCYMVSIPDPHGPNTVRAPYDSMFDPSIFKKPRTYDQAKDEVPLFVGMKQAQFSASGMAKYFGMVKCIDDNIGRIIERLKERQILERTVIVFTSDHGDLCGEHHRDNKGNPYEASARVPFIIAAPGIIPSGTVLNAAMTGVDFAPTLLSLLSASDPMPEMISEMIPEKIPDGMEGRDLSFLFETGSVPADFDDIVFLRKAGNSPGWIAAVTDRYKLVLSPEDRPWLFDLEEDPDELKNYFGSPSHKEITMKLARAIEAYGPAHQEPHLRTPEMIETLKIALQD